MSLNNHLGELSLHLVDAAAEDAFFIFFPLAMPWAWRVLDKPKFLSRFLYKVPCTGFGIKVFHMLYAGGYLLGKYVCH